MGPVGGVLVLALVGLALVGVGYWLGRVWPAPRPRRTPRDTGPRETRPMGRAARAATAPGSLDSGDRLQREIEQRVQTLRRAREQAEPWRAPKVDAVEEPESRVWFADTTVEPHVPRGSR